MLFRARPGNSNQDIMHVRNFAVAVARVLGRAVALESAVAMNQSVS